MSAELEQEIKEAIRNCEPDTLEVLLAVEPEALSCLKENLTCEFAEDREAYKIIPVIARYWPEFVHMRSSDQKTPLVYAVEQGQERNMIALAQAGADIRYQIPGRQNILSLATKLSDRCQGNELKKFLLTLRKMGFSLNETPDSENLSFLQQALTGGQWNDWIRHVVNAGANVYEALGVEPPKGKLQKDDLRLSFRNMVQRLHRPQVLYPAQLVQLQNAVMDEFPPAQGVKLGPEHFFNIGSEDGKPVYTFKKEVHHWEAFALLAPLFGKDAEALWHGGMSTMMEVYQRLPEYVRRDLHPIAALRDAPTPREDSITVRYMRGDKNIAHGKP